MDVVIVDSCLRNGDGGSPTGVVLNDSFTTDSDRQALPSELGVSHVGFVAPTSRTGEITVRFFTSGGELQGCGHGTLAVHAAIYDSDSGTEVVRRQSTGGGTFTVRSKRTEHGVMSWFDQGSVGLRHAEPDDALAEILAALGVEANDLPESDAPVVASPGAARLLVPLASFETLWSIRPDQPRLAEACRAHGLLGCFVYGPVAIDDNGLASTAARMFAPAIGVPEDIANANSTGCLAVHLCASGVAGRVSVDQGDALFHPSTIFAQARKSPAGWSTSVGGVARIRVSS